MLILFRVYLKYSHYIIRYEDLRNLPEKPERIHQTL